MASPNFDQLNVNLSHLIDDKVTSASTNGEVVTSLYRTLFLNDGIRVLLRKWTKEQNWIALKSYLKDGSASLSANTVLLSAWTGGVFEILSAKNNTDNVLILPCPEYLRYELESDVNPYLTPSATRQYYVNDGGYFRLLDGTSTSVDEIYLRYVKEHADLTVNNATDIQIESQYWDEVLQEAFKIYISRDPTDRNIARIKVAG
jgi:hypothetical protein